MLIIFIQLFKKTVIYFIDIYIWNLNKFNVLNVKMSEHIFYIKMSYLYVGNVF